MSYDIDYIQIQLASPKEIERWSQRILPNNEIVGEITKADTINYRTFKPERDGLFCERIFGSVINNECSCGKTRRRKPMQMQMPETLDNEMTVTAQKPNTDEITGYVCPTCGVEPTDAKVRRYRMGCIRLRKPVAHLWYFRNTPNILSVLLNLSAGQTDEILHFDSYTPSSPFVMNYFLHGGVEFYINEWDAFHSALGTVPVKTTDDPVNGNADGDVEAVWNKDAWAQADSQKSRVGFPLEARTTENCGAEAMHMLLSQLDLPFIERMLRTRLRRKVQEYHTNLRAKQAAGKYSETSNEDIEKLLKLTRQGQRNRGLNAKIKKLAKRLHYVRLLARKELRPEWMIVSVFPVLPPDLRPMIQMSSGRFAASDLNDLYRRLIYRKIRFDKFCNLFDAEFLPDLLIRHDLCLLQEAADAIIDNGRLEKPAQRPNKSVFKSLTAIIEGKQGRFRQNLLGKRVDYSGRSVIVVGPKLRLHQCGLPREMALELFHPFIIQALLEKNIVRNIRAAKNLIHKRNDQVWGVLERVVNAHPILLNRAPTLHRLGIQAFEPILLSGRAIQLHPLVCPAFNADFDGDQMAVHIPLSLEAQAEARLLMLATHNWLSPATGEPSIVPSQDMILGFYYLTTRRPVLERVHRKRSSKEVQQPTLKVFQTFEGVLQRYSLGALKLHELVWVKASSPADVQQASPLEVRVQSTGHNTLIYDSGVNESWPTPVFASAGLQGLTKVNDIGAEPIFASVPQLHRMASNTFYLRTTPGRLILNSVIYENLFL
jgi:DNA-directed RNA polymerase subunit beta'|tara:strand:- start:4285 stop:6594 length:2310 start_codon:yes stop_codon:yes gene_type:complete